MDNVKNRVNEITEQLEQGLKELFESKKYMEYLNTMSRFHDYSFNNILLIHMQKPDASLVHGYKAWKDDFGRQVMGEEHGIKILAPAPYKKTVMKAKLDQNGNKILDEKGNEIKEKTEIKIPAFKIVNVFDISQTTGRELPQIGTTELQGDVANYDIFFEALKKSCPVPIEFEKIGKPHAMGYCTRDRIALKEGISQIQSIKTTIHEMTHHKLHFSDDNERTRNGEEVEAESVAYTICKHFGIDTAEYSFGYIAGWSAGKDMPELKGALNTIRKASAEMISEISSNFEELIAERNIHEQAIEQVMPTITCEWSEHLDFKGGKTYSVLEFDSLMEKANEDWIMHRDLGDTRYNGYAKVKFTVNFSDGRKITERQDIGDAKGGVIDFFKSFQSYKYQHIADQLEQSVKSEKQNIAKSMGRKPSVLKNLNEKKKLLNDSSRTQQSRAHSREEIR